MLTRSPLPPQAANSFPQSASSVVSYDTMGDVIPLLGTSRVRRRILQAFFTEPGLVVHVRELSRRTGIPHGLAQRELRQLETWGILISETVGRARRYRFDERSAVAREVRTLFQRTVGVDAMLRAALEGLPGVEAAAIFGSHAAGTDRAGSDLDVLIVGAPDRAALSDRLADLEQETGREVNTVVLTQAELRRQHERGGGFVRGLLDGPLIPLVGELRVDEPAR